MPIGLLGKFGGRALGQAIDPTNYKFLKEAAENVLSRTVPQGVNFGALPTQFLNTPTDIQRMAPGAAKEAARNKAKTTLTRAARAQSPAPRPVGQGAGGALRAPSVGTQPVRPTPTTVAPRTNIPGSPLATDYALSRQTGMTQALGQARNASQAGAQNFLGRGAGVRAPGTGPLGLVELGLIGIDQLGRAIDPGFARKRAIADEYDAKFGADYSLTTEEMAERLGKNDTTTYSSVPGSSVPGFVGPVTQPTPGLIGPPVPLVESQQGAWTTKGWDPSAARTSPQETPPPAPILPPPSSLPPEERAYQVELARTQQMMASNPYMPQMNLYAQGQRAMQTPEDMAATRDLGLAINRAMYGDMTTPKTANPLMAGLNPPGATQPVIPMDEEGRIGQLDTAAEGVQEFMRKYAEGMKKRKGEE